MQHCWADEVTPTVHHPCVALTVKIQCESVGEHLCSYNVLNDPETPSIEMRDILPLVGLTYDNIYFRLLGALVVALCHGNHL